MSRFRYIAIVLICLSAFTACLSSKRYVEDRLDINQRIDNKFFIGTGMSRNKYGLFYKPDWYYPFSDSIPEIPKYESYYCFLENPLKYLLLGDTVLYAWGESQHVKVVIRKSLKSERYNARYQYFKDSAEMESAYGLKKYDSLIVQIHKI